jgi:hypothetical protein
MVLSPGVQPLFGLLAEGYVNVLDPIHRSDTVLRTGRATLGLPCSKALELRSLLIKRRT